MINRKEVAVAVLLACLTLAIRVPFLMRGEAFFDSDEAVEGLMARHVLRGELPTFYWGQSYKGVPEVYVSAAAMAVFGSSAALLKTVTAVLFALYVGASSVLLGRWFDRRAAIGSSLLAAVGPPALMYWTLSANAEFVLVMLLGTVLLLLAPTWDGFRTHRVAFGVVAGLGAWIHPLILCYLLPLAVLGLLGSAWWRVNRGRRLVRAIALGKADRGARPLVLFLNAAALSYAAFGLTAFVTGGAEFSPFGLLATVHHPQKMFAVALLLLMTSIAIAAHAEFRVTRNLWRAGWPVLAGFLAGYVPVLAHALAGGRVGAPLRSMDAAGLWRVIPHIGIAIPRILAGFASPFASTLPLPVWLAVPGGVCLALYLWNSRAQVCDTLTLRPRNWTLAEGFFPVFLVLLAAVFIASGMCLDAYSYRYLIPAYAAVPLALTMGCRSTGRWARWLPGALFVAVAGVFAAEQVLWFRTLAPGSCDRQLAACLRSAGVRGGRADYWISYRMTFLSDEDPIIAPVNGVDRYPPYSRFVAGLSRAAEVTRSAGAPDPAQCRCGDLEARVSAVRGPG